MAIASSLYSYTLHSATDWVAQEQIPLGIYDAIARPQAIAREPAPMSAAERAQFYDAQPPVLFIVLESHSRSAGTVVDCTINVRYFCRPER